MKANFPNLVERNLEDYGLNFWEEYYIESIKDISFSELFWWDIDEEIENTWDYWTHTAKWELTIPQGTKMKIMFHSSKVFVKISVIWKFDISERESNDKRYSRLKVLKDAEFNTLFTVKSNNNNPNWEDFWKNTIRRDGSFIIEAWKFWMLFHMPKIGQNVEIRTLQWDVKSNVRDLVAAE